MYSEVDVMDGLIEAYLTEDDKVGDRDRMRNIVSRDNNAGIEQVIARNGDGRTFMFSVTEVFIHPDGTLQV